MQNCTRLKLPDVQLYKSNSHPHPPHLQSAFAAHRVFCYYARELNTNCETQCKSMGTSRLLQQPPRAHTIGWRYKAATTKEGNIHRKGFSHLDETRIQLSSTKERAGGGRASPERASPRSSTGSDV